MSWEKKLRKKLSKYQKQCLNNPSNITLQLRVAQLHIELGEIKNAIDRYYQIVQVIRDSGQHRVSIKVSNWLIDIYQRIIDLAPFDKNAYQGLGEEYCQRREFSKALNLYTSFLQKLIQAEKYEDALAQCANILILDPNNLSIRETYVNLLYRLGMSEKCAAELKEIAELYLLQNRPEEAFSYYLKALELNPLDSDLQEKLSKVSGIQKSSKPVPVVPVEPLDSKESSWSKPGSHLERDLLEENLKRVLESKERAEKLLATLEFLQPGQDNRPLRSIIKQRIADLEVVETEIRGQMNAS